MEIIKATYEIPCTGGHPFLLGWQAAPNAYQGTACKQAGFCTK